MYGISNSMKGISFESSSFTYVRNEVSLLFATFTFVFTLKSDQVKDFLPSFATNGDTQNGFCYITRLYVHFTVESRITVWVADVHSF